MVKTYNLSDLIPVTKKTLSKGNQIKYLLGTNWIKLDTLRYESLAEVLASQVCEGLHLSHVKYSLCKITDGYTTWNACISEDFTKGYEEVSLGSIIQQLTGQDIDLEKYNLLADRVKAVYEPLQLLIGYDIFLQYLTKLFALDCILYNEDRYLYNIAFLKKATGLKPAPIFDCGAGLLSDVTIDYHLDVPLEVCLRRIKSKPFSASFKKQTAFFESLCGSPFTPAEVLINLADLQGNYSKSAFSRALQVLEIGLNHYNIKLRF